MRRLEGINQAAVDAFKKIVDNQENSFMNIFKAGVEWADNHQPSLTELDILKHQREVLNELLPKYTGKTLDNVLVNIEARIKEGEK